MQEQIEGTGGPVAAQASLTAVNTDLADEGWDE